MKRDITSRKDIEQLIAGFYEKVKPDPTIGFIFTDIVTINWEHHIPVIVDFWEGILLDNPVYQRNAMDVHYQLNKQLPLQKIHFETWLRLFTSTIDELFEGTVAGLAKTRAKSIAALMEFKMTNINNNQSLI